jgi:hypothetical protein
MEGLRHQYVNGLAVDPGDPHNVIVSASVGPGNANSIGDAESYVYRKDENGKNGMLFQMVFLSQVEQQLLFLLQIQKLRENSMLLTTVVYFSLLIQVFHGGH